MSKVQPHIEQLFKNDLMTRGTAPLLQLKIFRKSHIETGSRGREAVKLGLKAHKAVSHK